jgi:hypothetical protein
MGIVIVARGCKSLRLLLGKSLLLIVPVCGRPATPSRLAPYQLGVRIQVPPESEAIKPHIEGVETLSQIFPNAALIHAVCDENQRAASL